MWEEIKITVGNVLWTVEFYCTSLFFKTSLAVISYTHQKKEKDSQNENTVDDDILQSVDFIF